MKLFINARFIENKNITVPALKSFIPLFYRYWDKF